MGGGGYVFNTHGCCAVYNYRLYSRDLISLSYQVSRKFSPGGCDPRGILIRMRRNRSAIIYSCSDVLASRELSNMRRGSVLQAVLLSVATLQLQSASGSPMTWAKPVRAQAFSASDIVEKAENFVKVCLAVKHVAVEHLHGTVFVRCVLAICVYHTVRKYRVAIYYRDCYIFYPHTFSVFMSI